MKILRILFLFLNSVAMAQSVGVTPVVTPIATPSIIGTPVNIPAFGSASYTTNLNAVITPQDTTDGTPFFVNRALAAATFIDAAWYYNVCADKAMLAGNLTAALKFFARAQFYQQSAIGANAIPVMDDSKMANLTLFLNSYSLTGKHL